jgi:hypothetical protein
MSELAVSYLVPCDAAEAPNVLIERHSRRLGNSTMCSVAR